MKEVLKLYRNVGSNAVDYKKKVKLQLNNRIVGPEDNTIEDLKKVFLEKKVSIKAYKGRSASKSFTPISRLKPIKDDLVKERYNEFEGITNESLSELYKEINKIHEIVEGEKKSTTFEITLKDRSSKDLETEPRHSPLTSVETTIVKDQNKLKNSNSKKSSLSNKADEKKQHQQGLKMLVIKKKRNTKPKQVADEMTVASQSLVQNNLEDDPNVTGEVYQEFNKLPEKRAFPKLLETNTIISETISKPLEMHSPPIGISKNKSNKLLKDKKVIQVKPIFIERIIKTKYETYKLRLYQQIDPTLESKLTHKQINEMFMADDVLF